MSGADIRVPFALMLGAFGLDITVTRPAPDDTPIETTGIWVSPTMEDVPFGADVQRREPKRVLAVSLADVPTLPTGSVIEAPEEAGGVVKTWRVDGFDRIESDHYRPVLVAA